MRQDYSACLWDPLYEQIQAFVLDQPCSALPFLARLARDNLWTGSFAQKVCEEYRNYLFLAAIADHVVTPSVAVDEAWHLHMTYTKSYWNGLCGTVLGRPLHHDPTEGGETVLEFHKECYERTLATYERVFRRKPPADIWPEVNVRFCSTSRVRRVDLEYFRLVPRPGPWSRRLPFAIAGAALCAVGWLNMGAEWNWGIPAAIFAFGAGLLVSAVFSAQDLSVFMSSLGVADQVDGCGGCGGGAADVVASFLMRTTLSQAVRPERELVARDVPPIKRRPQPRQ